jgi:aspartyl-tRNA synthetase
MGIDRLLMALTGLGIRETILFPLVRSESRPSVSGPAGVPVSDSAEAVSGSVLPVSDTADDVSGRDRDVSR